MKYTRLTQAERYQIAAYKESGKSCVWIATRLHRHESSIRREIRRNSTVQGYEPEQASRMAVNRRAYCNSQRRKVTGKVLEYVVQRLREGDSPEQLSGRLNRVEGILISHETLYQFVHSRVGKRLNLKQYLRHGGRKYQRRDKRKYAGRGYIPDRVDIDERPAIVEEKSRIGDWEVDTIVGAGHKGYIVSLVDRMSKFTKLVLVPNCKAKTVTNAILKALKPYQEKVFTLTADNGKEFSDHKTIAKQLAAAFFFAKPYHSWQRGLNEHTNGLVRQFLPKKTNFLNISTDFVQRIENNLNNRPRKTLNYLIPAELFFYLTPNSALAT